MKTAGPKLSPKQVALNNIGGAELGYHEIRKGKKMPKNKTHSGAKKRFRVTGSGKLMREQAGRRHLLEHKSSRRKRRLAADRPVSDADTRQTKRLLGK